MPFYGVSAMDQRIRFVAEAILEGANVRAVCRSFGISPTTGYKWLERARMEGGLPLSERSRRPLRSPRRTDCELEAQVVAVRLEHPCWGGRKIHHVLRRRGVAAPHPNTITEILHRHGLVTPEASAQRRPFLRFERARPNELWQMDFKGHFAIGSGRCHPLTVIDDHSRFAVMLRACANERRASVEPALVDAFRRYGLPEAILVDNGPPWGKDFEHRHTGLTAWLMRLGVAPCHGRPYHPQTRGKNERFNATLALEAIAGQRFDDLAQAQDRFDVWRAIYNHERPHQGIGDAPPASRFALAPRRFPEKLEPILYPGECCVRLVQKDGRIAYKGRTIFISGAFAGLPIGLRPTEKDGVFDVLFCAFNVAKLDITQTRKSDEQTVHHVPVHPSTICPG